MSGAKKLLHNTILLTATSFLMRTVSVSFNVYLTNKIGADGIGLFQLIAAVYGMAITFASAGVRLASMRLIADNLTEKKHSERRLMSLCIGYSLLCGVFMACVLSGFSDIIGQKWICDTRSIPSLKVLSLSLPFISVSAALGGYFTSVGKLVRYTAVQLCEQIFKIGVTVFSLKAVLSHGLEASCVAIVFGMTSAEIFSAFCSYILYLLSTEKADITEKASAITKKMLRIALPDAIGAEMRSILMTVEHLLIPVGFRKSGSNPQTAMATYGTIHGMALPLVLYPSALLSSLSGLLVPEISAQHIVKNHTRIGYMTARVLHITLIFSIGTAGVMYFTSGELALAVYNNESVGFYTQVLSPLIPVMYMDMTIDGILKGLDQQVSYMRYNIIDACICVVFVYLLVPVFAVKGYIMVVFMSEIINFFLSFRRLTMVSEVRVDLFRDIVIPVLCIVSAGCCKNIFFTLFPFDFGSKGAAAAGIIVCTGTYIMLLRIFTAINKEELLWARRLTTGKIKNHGSRGF
ncbi:MAG: polysaccharide biosynthesis C-terminal domain-containing protein [Clostridia bacterium]|nr:polysaccharide biosynthesis C-terminal domain-containing protein [Clostridia bacterium]